MRVLLNRAVMMWEGTSVVVKSHLGYRVGTSGYLWKCANNGICHPQVVEFHSKEISNDSIRSLALSNGYPATLIKKRQLPHLYLPRSNPVLAVAERSPRLSDTFWDSTTQKVQITP